MVSPEANLNAQRHADMSRTAALSLHRWAPGALTRFPLGDRLYIPYVLIAPRILVLVSTAFAMSPRYVCEATPVILRMASAGAYPKQCLYKKSGARWLCACVSRQDDELDETPEILSDSRR